MTRVAMLRAGHVALGLAFVALAASAYVGALLLVGLGLGFVAGILLAFSADELPKYAGLALLVYFLLAVVAFLAATPITVNRGGERFFANPAPPDMADDVLYWMGLVSPLILAGAALVAAWEREVAPRVLLAAAAGGFVLLGVLSLVLVPQLDPTCAVDPFAPGCAGAAARAAAEAQRQGDLLRALSAVSALAAAVGAFWAGVRTEAS